MTKRAKKYKRRSKKETGGDKVEAVLDRVKKTNKI